MSGLQLSGSSSPAPPPMFSRSEPVCGREGPLLEYVPRQVMQEAPPKPAGSPGSPGRSHKWPSLPAFMSHPAASSLDAEQDALPQQRLSAHVPGVWRVGALSSMQVNLG